MDEGGNAGASLVDGLAGLLAETVDRGGIAVKVAEEREHFGEGFGAQRVVALLSR